MRMIKFRGKDIKTGEWLYVDLRNKESVTEAFIATIHRCNVKINPITIGQFTGLIDKNGKEIYEGDILCEIETNRKAAVVYEAPQFCYADNDFGYKFLNLPENYEVIGNIHDNPELLNSL